MVSYIVSRGIEEIADDSSGNAGSSLAAYAAKANISCRIYTPASASEEKLIQIAIYGADLTKVKGQRHHVTEKLLEDKRKAGFYYASHNINPYFLEGAKTIAFEVCEQFDWDPPAHLIFPVGGGALIIGAYNGFRQLKQMELIEDMPKLHVAQSESCDPVVKAFNDDGEFPDITPRKTIAEGIHIKKPERGHEIMQVLKESGGGAVSVKEEVIKEFFQTLPQKEGIFCEPTSAVAIAALKELVEKNDVQTDEKVLIPLTGGGLNDIKSAKLLKH